jgi:anion-transporting  ArsA/GET3 family ATPase
VFLEQLLARRLVFVSGKGGVGKSVVAAALALAASQRGRRTLLVEIDAPLQSAAPLLGGQEAQTTDDGSRARDAGRERALAPGLFGVNLVPKQVMDEYVHHVVKLAVLARRIFESPIYERFFAAAPGLKELMTLGKIMTLESAHEPWSRRPLWDFIVVDAPATGHGLALLKVPLAATSAVPVGPVGANARRVLALLRDKLRTALLIVAMPEELAAVEAAQFYRLAEDEVGIETAGLVLNACHERRLDRTQEAEVLARLAAGADGALAPGVSLRAALVAARRHIRRRRLAQFYATRLRRAVPVPQVALPFLFDDRLGPRAVQALAERLARA